MISIFSFLCLFNKYLLSVYQVPGTVIQLVPLNGNTLTLLQSRSGISLTYISHLVFSLTLSGPEKALRNGIIVGRQKSSEAIIQNSMNREGLSIFLLYSRVYFSLSSTSLFQFSSFCLISLTDHNKEMGYVTFCIYCYILIFNLKGRSTEQYILLS